MLVKMSLGLFFRIGFCVGLASVLSCTSVSKEDQNRAALHMQIGTGYLAQGHYPQAIAELQKSSQLDPTNPTIQNNLGLAYYVRGRLKKAEEKFQKAIDLDPKYSDPKNNLARVWIDQKRLREAIELLHEVEGDLTYTAPEKTFSNLGMAHFESGQFKEAERYLLKSLSMRRESCTTSHYYGRTLYALKRIPEAAKTLDQAVEFCRNSKFEEPLLYSAMSYYAVGDKERARARLNELLKNYPQSPFVAKAKGMLELLQE